MPSKPVLADRAPLGHHKGQIKSLFFHSLGTCKGILTCGIIRLSKKGCSLDHIGPGSILQYDLMRSGHVVHTRTIREAAAYFQEADPHTSLTETAIRTLLSTGVVPSARMGRKYLVPLRLWKPTWRAPQGRRSPSRPRLESGRSSEGAFYRQREIK